MKFTKLVSALALAAFVSAGATAAQAQQKTDFKVAWSIYVGWMPWGYAADTGIVKKWADKYGLTIEVTQFNDYVESMNQYTAGAYDAVTLTNMDGLSIPAAGGVDTTAVIIGDFSAGNDAVGVRLRRLPLTPARVFAALAAARAARAQEGAGA